jgi:putative flippase GtrA
MEFIKYFSGSLLSLFVDLAIYYFCIYFNVLSPPIASIISYICGLMVMYFFSIHFVFKKLKFNKKRRLEASLFFLSGLIGVLITYSTVYIYFNLMGLSALTAKSVAIGLSFISVYAFRKIMLFN